MTANFSLETMEAKNERLLKEKDCPMRILYFVKLSFETEGEIKTFSDKQKLSEIISCSVQIHTTRNGKEFFNQKELISDENLDIQEEMKSTQNGEYVGKYKNKTEN